MATAYHEGTPTKEWRLRARQVPYNQNLAMNRHHSAVADNFEVQAKSMAEQSKVEQLVEQAVAQVLESQLPQLREGLVRRVVEQVRPQLGASPEASPANLLKGIAAIHAGATQREILRALLDNAVLYCGRSALFVIKSGAATGWQGRGFANSDSIKDFSLDASSGVAARALQSRIPMSGGASEMDTRFVAEFGAAGDDHVLVLPLLLKDKVAALVYADPGAETGGSMDAAALELLVVSAGAWLEVVSLRKQAQKEAAAEPAMAAAAPPVQTVASFSDPFAGHAPVHAATSPPAAVAEPSPAEAPVVVAENTAGAAAAPAIAGDALAQMPPEAAEIHRKAQRFARLLVDEIKLYNQAKVAEGRKNKDLYNRLKEDLEKSNATYKKRYGNTAAASGDYFYAEVVRSLAEDDVSIMGADFRR